MADNIENQDVELHEDEEISEMKHDPKNAEAQSIASVDKAGETTGTVGARKMAGGTAKDNTKKDPMPKTKAGMIAAMVGKMQGKMEKKFSEPSFQKKFDKLNNMLDGLTK